MVVLGTSLAQAQMSEDKEVMPMTGMATDTTDMNMQSMGKTMVCTMCMDHKSTIMDMKMKMAEDMMMSEKMVMDIKMLNSKIVELNRYKRHAMMVLKDGQKRKVMKMIEMEMMDME